MRTAAVPVEPTDVRVQSCTARACSVGCCTPAAGAPVAWADLAARIAWLDQRIDALASRAGSLARLISDEVGKPLHEAAIADVMALLAAMRWTSRHAPSILSTRRAGWGSAMFLGRSIRTERAPLGHVAIIGTWNYPLQLLGVQVVHALIAGNRVTVKPSERCPRTHAALIDLLMVGLPDGMLVATEPTREAGERLLAGGRFDHVVFTGSSAVGRRVAQRCALDMIPSTLELSGSDSALVLADADPVRAARAVWNGFTMNAGQTCMAPRRAIVAREVAPAFVHELRVLAASAAPVRLIDDAAALQVDAAVHEAVAAGGLPITGVLEARAGRSMRPSIVVGAPASSALARGEHFGPALAVLVEPDDEAVVERHRGYGQNLSASVFTRGTPERRMVESLGASIVTINECVVASGHPAVPLAGSGESGWGTSRGADGLLAMTRPVTVATTRRGADVPVGTPPPMVLRALAWLLRADLRR
jgi:acyl-CoA reductase-like NAD-dependent aldehyde dehydrogenase